MKKKKLVTRVIIEKILNILVRRYVLKTIFSSIFKIVIILNLYHMINWY